RFTVSLAATDTTAMGPGLYRLLLVAYSDSLAQVSERSLELEAAPAIKAATVIPTATAASEAATVLATEETMLVEATLTAMPPTAAAEVTRAPATQPRQLPLIPVVIALAVIAVAAVALLRRR
ncbi:MAG: hypothetical protein ACUVWR_13680, partial [Anaerolineae bacterium]